MASESNQLFLLSLSSLCVVASCADGLPGGVPSSTPINTDDDDNALSDGNSEPTNSASRAICGAFADAYLNCRVDDYGGGQYEGYVAELVAECAANLDLIASTDPECGAQFHAWYACLGAADCSGFNDQACLDEATRVQLQCDEGFDSGLPPEPGGGQSGVTTAPDPDEDDNNGDTTTGSGGSGG